ncbi:MAG TPA: hypothetical protein VKA57_12665, partial [Solirubrobacteraceae bacterium]|nr:hypothetical protein [Solirubrobacteraceae bacterium]
MRRLVLLAAIALAGCGGGGGEPRPTATPAATARPQEPGAGAAAERWPQPERYALDVTYDDRRFALRGSERIELRN